MSRHIHDCDCCKPLGEFQQYDLYFCEQGGISDTVIARSGPQGEYKSGLIFAAHDPALGEAKKRAQQKGYLQ